MPVAVLNDETDFDGWRKAARAFRLAGVEPAAARFAVAGGAGQGGLFDIASGSDVIGAPVEAEFTVPKAFVELAESVIRTAPRIGSI